MQDAFPPPPSLSLYNTRTENKRDTYEGAGVAAGLEDVGVGEEAEGVHQVGAQVAEVGDAVGLWFVGWLGGVWVGWVVGG